MALGRRLFVDPVLSADRRTSCASCHPLDRGATDGRQHAVQIGDARFLRDTPTVFNLAFDIAYNWDGSAPTVERVIHKVVQSPKRFNSSLQDIVAKLRADRGYVAAFEAAYVGGLAPQTVVDALAAYLLSLVTPDSRFDRHLRGDAAALTAGELNGYDLFKSVGCVACHQGVNVGGNVFQRFGVFAANAPRSGNRIRGGSS